MTKPASRPTREFTITRVFDAPRELVFRAWTDPEQLTRWFGPRGVTTPRSSIETDVRPGGDGEFTEGESVVTVVLSDLGDKTEMTFHQTGFTTEQGRANVQDGWSQSLDRLAESLN